MKVVFETAGGQRLQAELSGEHSEAFEKKLVRLCKSVRNGSTANVGIQDTVRHYLRDYVLIVKEPSV
jgi:hypothetical protein